MQRMIWSALAAFAVTLVIGPTVIKLLMRLKVGQQIYGLAPEAHKSKQGTPTMGGLMIAFIAILFAFLFRSHTVPIIFDIPFAICVFALLNLALGFADDFLKVRRKKNQGGLTEMQKTVPQVIIAVAFAAYCAFSPYIGTMIMLPFTSNELNLGLAYIPIMAFVVYCVLNAANFLDGLDGLLGSVSLVIFAAFGIIALIFASQIGAGANQTQLVNTATLCAATAGALMGYLRYNLHPAQMMMGDTGSMFIGAVFVGVGMTMRIPIWLPFAGVMMLVSLLSTTIQRVYYKATHGKRVFKNSPYHHHLEMMGMSETRIVSMYVLVTVLFCLLCFLGLPITI
ncbi:MAG: phospho-N-acetylmuramoyl-pentapeptide-transferase [Oscillospiraceae bacterium]|jgi:phospho-N-acetylmuramoyl-pentapeptide-transferase|nr:phospho-N-acetylmuramoyl-pentapeptide-transferase [Oscillospiraceae bacterium]